MRLDKISDLVEIGARVLEGLMWGYKCKEN